MDISQGIFADKPQKVLREFSGGGELHNHRGPVADVQYAIGGLSLLQGGRVGGALSAGFPCSATGGDVV